jgi:hypothetical protein
MRFKLRRGHSERELVLAAGARAWRPLAELGQRRGQRGACGRRQWGELEGLSTRERRVGAARSRRWCRSGYNDGAQRRRPVRAGVRAAWQGEEMASMGWGSAAQTLGRHVARGKAARRRRVRSTRPARVVGRRREETEEERGWR